jgi:membrane associated rhomboid family serine protease
MRSATALQARAMAVITCAAITWAGAAEAAPSTSVRKPIGASGITHGLGFMLFGLAILRRDRPAIAAAMIAFFFFGSMLLTVLPQELGVSWEYHLSGAVFGVVAAALWYRADPAPPRKRYSWEDEAELEAVADPEHELPRPDEVPVLWHRPPPPSVGKVLPFRRQDLDS